MSTSQERPCVVDDEDLGDLFDRAQIIRSVHLEVADTLAVKPPPLRFLADDVSARIGLLAGDRSRPCVEIPTRDLEGCPDIVLLGIVAHELGHLASDAWSMPRVGRWPGLTARHLAREHAANVKAVAVVGKEPLEEMYVRSVNEELAALYGPDEVVVTLDHVMRRRPSRLHLAYWERRLAQMVRAMDTDGNSDKLVQWPNPSPLTPLPATR